VGQVSMNGKPAPLRINQILSDQPPVSDLRIAPSPCQPHSPGVTPRIRFASTRRFAGGPSQRGPVPDSGLTPPPR
jgi:hypothetical protein